MADTYLLLAFQNLFSSKEAHAKAKFLIKRSLEIGETLGEAHTSLGYIYEDTGDWKQAEIEFKKAIDLNPSYATARFWYGILLSWLGRHDEAIAQAKKAVELDPFSPSMMPAVGQALDDARRYDEAIEWLLSTIQANPDVYSPRFVLAIVYFHKGEYARALDEAKEAIALSETPTERVVMTLGLAEAGLGHKEEARNILRDLEQSHAQMVLLARLHQALGEREEAMRCLETAYQNEEPLLGWLTVIHDFDGLRNDVRFISLMAKISSPRRDA